MKTSYLLCLAMCAFAGALTAADAAAPAPEAAAAAPKPPPAPDVITLKDGSIIVGRIQSMTGGKLVVVTDFGEAITIKWENVTGIKSSNELKFLLSKETTVNGSAAPGEAGTLVLTAPSLGNPVTAKLGDVMAINPPPPKPEITYKGNANIAVSISDGNTRTKTASANAAFEARSERQRLTIAGAWNYSQNQDGLTARNANGRIKYDFFATKRLYFFASAFLEGDSFQDLKLRTALSAGPGYQLIDRGDFEGVYASKLEVFGEAGVSYFNEDFRRAPDQDYMSARWALKIDWPFLPDKVTFFHYHEGYPSMEDIKDFYVTSETGFRFNLTKNFTAGVQVNYRYDSTPAEKADGSTYLRGDALYLFTLGYNFEA